MGENLSVDSTLAYPYTRTTGPVLGPFLTALRDGRVLGVRCGDRVLCPPLEFDPETGDELIPDFVEVGPGGVVEGWTWVAEPTEKHPFAHPFAFALIRLDGADTALVHAIDTGSIDTMATGMRVQAQFRDERHGAITDVYFVAEGDAVDQAIEPGEEPVTITEHFIAVRMREDIHPFRARYYDALLQGRFLGQRSPADGKVYVPSRGYDPLNRVPMTEADDVDVADVGTVTSFTEITPVQYYGQEETEPYLRCSILLDGSDSPVSGIDIRDVPAEEFRVGLRVRCIWRPAAERELGDVSNRWGAIPETVFDRWEPTGEPDVDPELLKEHNF
ncbi:MAG: OB-fold domain-containing protein [Acidimicrobiia bacterium]|nr:OB-fold domain-containing protein [Acidimicrobiia bacterium]MDH5237999.1 OB-fold domain-containing protein [Acidimicrobiia bacterium]